jgi:hypothetical protein
MTTLVVEEFDDRVVVTLRVRMDTFLAGGRP